MGYLVEALKSTVAKKFVIVPNDIDTTNPNVTKLVQGKRIELSSNGRAYVSDQDIEDCKKKFGVDIIERLKMTAAYRGKYLKITESAQPPVEAPKKRRGRRKKVQ